MQNIQKHSLVTLGFGEKKHPEHKQNLENVKMSLHAFKKYTKFNMKVFVGLIWYLFKTMDVL